MAKCEKIFLKKLKVRPVKLSCLAFTQLFILLCLILLISSVHPTIAPSHTLVRFGMSHFLFLQNKSQLKTQPYQPFVDVALLGN